MDGRQEVLKQVFAVTGRHTLDGHPRFPPRTIPPGTASQIPSGRPRHPGAPYGGAGAFRHGPGRGVGGLRPARVRMGWRDLILKQ
ncbi:hypothetical protein HOK021_32170 [Streptomyces hygroscopicus]|nr:hypothetical protein HOK021_32170 [Streptomyces hygroscopicus]